MNKDIINAIDSLHVIHHQSVYAEVCFKEIPLKPISVPYNIKIVTVSDKENADRFNVLHNNIPQGSVKNIYVDTYIPWLTKVVELKNFIKLNYDNIPDYIMYLDKFDTAVVNDIPCPERILDFYNCKILFNKEGQNGHDGCMNPSEKYYQDFLDSTHKKHEDTIEKIYGIKKVGVGLNAGAFLGEKKALLEILEEMLDYHYSKPYTEGFPYGWVDDQSVFKYMFLKYPNIIRLDLFNKIFTQAHHEEFDSNNSNYFNYHQKFESIFNNKEI